MPDLHVFELASAGLDDAYALVRLGTSLSLGEWRDLNGLLRSECGGVLGISAGGVLLGLAGYRVDPSFAPGRSLKVSPFIACELSASGAVRDALLRGLRSVAERLNCRQLAIAGACRGRAASGSVEA